MPDSFSDFFNSNNRLLVAVASGGEFGAVLKALNQNVDKISKEWCVSHFDSLSILQTGVGKSNSAGAVTHELTIAETKNRRYGAVLSFGIAGSLDEQVKIGSTVFGSAAVFADEGTPCLANQEWTSLEESGWALTCFQQNQHPWSQYLSLSADHIGIIATVSTISGTNEIAAQYAKRTGALAEGMEGAAIAQVCSRLAVPFAELRVISNRCGNRDVNKLDIPTSFTRLTQVVQDWKFDVRKILFHLVLVSLLCIQCAKPVAALDEDTYNTPVADKWALIVGVSKFTHENLNLRWAAKDAEDFYQYLITKGQFKPDHVKLLTDEQATEKEIVSELGGKWLPHVAAPDDLVVIFISSHGSPAYMDTAGVNYILAHDSDPDDRTPRLWRCRISSKLFRSESMQIALS